MTKGMGPGGPSAREPEPRRPSCCLAQGMESPGLILPVGVPSSRRTLDPRKCIMSTRQDDYTACFRGDVQAAQGVS